MLTRLVLLSTMTLIVAVAEPKTSPAIAWADCAPWDGPAFVVAVGRPGGKTADLEHPWLSIAIWHEAGSRHGVTYRFPDTDGRTGAVSFEGSAFPSVSGSVTFSRETRADKVEGTFDLVAPTVDVSRVSSAATCSPDRRSAVRSARVLSGRPRRLTGPVRDVDSVNVQFWGTCRCASAARAFQIDSSTAFTCSSSENGLRM